MLNLHLSQSAWTQIAVLGTAGLVATACALVGSFLVLRRMALIGDAISHAILPGIVIGFLFGQSLSSVFLLVGAAAAGLLTVWLVELLYRTRRLHEDTAIGVVFPALFALGVILISVYAKESHVDSCLLAGELGWSKPRDMLMPLIAAVFNLILVTVLYNPLKLSTFDPQLAQASGFSPLLLHYLLMSAVSLTTVACFRAVGALLVVAFLIVPAATAYLLTDRLWLLLVLAVAFGLLAAISGYLIAGEAVLNSSISGAMATMTGVWFVVVWLTAPRYGLLAVLVRRQRLRRQFLEHLLLSHLKKVGSMTPGDCPAGLPHGTARRLLDGLRRGGLVELQNGGLALTPAGQVAATAEDWR